MSGELQSVLKGRNLLELLNEILVEIIKELDGPRDTKNIQDMRLTCRILSTFATSVMFRDVKLPDNSQHLQRATEILVDEMIAKNIHTLRIFCTSVLPRGTAKPGHDQYETVNTVEKLLPRWAVAFALCVSRILSASSSSIRTLKIRGMSTNLDQYHSTARMLEEAVFTSIAECLSAVTLTTLKQITINCKHLSVASSLWDMYRNSGRGERLVSNLEGLDSFSLRNAFTVSHHSKKDLGKFLSFVPALQVSSLKLFLASSDPPVPMVVAPIAHNRTLTGLDLGWVAVSDNLSRVIAKLTRLRRLVLEFIDIDKDLDSWEEVFLACAEMKRLNYLRFLVLEYAGAPHCSDDEMDFCSERPGDIRAAQRLQEHTKTTLPERVETCVWPMTAGYFCDGSCV